MILIDQHPFLTISSDFAEICKPIELFNISHFTYQKHFNDGSRITLSNKPEWISDYYNLHLYETSLFEAKPSLYQASYNIWIGDFDLEIYRHGKLYYNTSPSITITEPQDDGCEFYLFSSTPEHEGAIHYLANNMDLLYHFIFYLKDKASHLFKEAKKSKIFLLKGSVEVSNANNPINDKSYYEKMHKLKKEFYKNTRIHQYVFDHGPLLGVKLTSREILCISNLLENKSANEIALAMNISRRTVESYLENIKVKLNCTNKAELIDLIKNYKLNALS